MGPFKAAPQRAQLARGAQGRNGRDEKVAKKLMQRRKISFRMLGMRILALALSLVCLSGAAWAAAPAPRLKPPAPPSPWIEQDQAYALQLVFSAIEDRQYAAATAFADDLTDPLARDISQWAILFSSSPTNTVGDYDAFLDSHPTWPSQRTLQRKAEKLIDEDTSLQTILEFFDTREPLSGFAKLHLGRALLALGDEEQGAEYIRKAWIEHNFNSADSKDIVRRHSKVLREKDHFAKADRALFRRTTAGTEDVDGLLSAEHQRQVNARRGLLRGRTSGRTAFNRLSKEEQQDAGVLLAMVRYLRRKEREEEAIAIAAHAPLSPYTLRNPESWYYERRLLARWALKNGRFEDAYRLTAYSALTDGSQFAEAEFLAGWIALRFLGEPERAAAHFDFMTSKVSSPISLARGNYWQARAWMQAGELAKAKSHYRVAAEYPYTYYGQLAIESLGNGAPKFDFPEPPVATAADRVRLHERELARALEILDDVDEDLHFRRFAYALDDQLAEPGEVRAYAELVRDAGHFDLIVRGGKASRAQGATVPEVIYPLYPVPSEAKEFVEAPLILGLSRQESEFKVNAYSSAKAKGMMQLLDGTAKITARKEGLPYKPSMLLADPDYNMTLGAAHLSHLLDRFSGSYVMVLAAYNAGPHRVKRWVEEYGDPRDPSVDPVDWVELIPFNETRNYVMRVLENVQVYRSQLDNLPLGAQLTEDITRGSPASFAAIGQNVPTPLLFGTADQAGPPLLSEEQIGSPPLAMLRAQSLADEGETITAPLFPNDPPVSASNR